MAQLEVHELLNGADAAGSGPERILPLRRTTLPVQVDPGTATTFTVFIEGRMGPDYGWVQLASVSAAGVTEVPPVARIRATVDSTDGTVNAAVLA